MHIGITMRRLRLDAGIKRNAMAKKMGISTQAIFAIENGTSLPKRSTVDKFCEVMGICRAKLILESLCWDDLPADLATTEDVMDIVHLALLRLKRAEGRG